MEGDFVSIIYYFKFVYLVQDLFFETGEIEILDLYGLYHIWGKCNIWYSMVIKRTDFNYFPLMCMETITKRIRLRFLSTDPKKLDNYLSEGFSSVLHRTKSF